MIDRRCHADRRWTAGLVGLAIAARIAAVVLLESHTVPRSTYEHGEIAANLVQGRGFSIAFLGADGPTSQQAPVYPVLLAVAYACLGVESPAALLAIQLGQAVLGGVLTLGVMRLTRLWLPERAWAARLAGLLAAAHPTLVYTATHIQVAGLAATLLVWLVIAAERTGAGVRGGSVALGILLALLLLTDPILVLAVPAVVWIVRRASDGRAWNRLAVAGGVAALGLAPWLVRNALVHGEFVFVKSTFGYAFWQGNCALSAGTDKVVRATVAEVLERPDDGTLAGAHRTLWAARHEAGYLDDIALSAAEKQELGRLREPERSRVLMRRALAELQADPARYPRLCFRRLMAFLFFDETNPKTRQPLYRAGHLGLTLLALLGLARADRQTLGRLGPSLLTFALLALFHAATIVSARFHIPVEPFMAIWGGSLAAASAGYPRRLTVSKASGSSSSGLAA
jgi:hypothetical protein